MILYRIGEDGYLAGTRELRPDEPKIVPKGWTAVPPPDIPEGMFARWNPTLRKWEIATVRMAPSPPRRSFGRRVHEPPIPPSDMKLDDWLAFGAEAVGNEAHAAYQAICILRRLIEECSSFEELKEMMRSL